MHQPEIAPAPAFTNFSAELLLLCVAGQLQRRLDAGWIEVGVQAGQVQARAGQVEADATRAPLSASGQLAGRAEVDQQGAEIGARAVAQHRAGEVGQRQALLVESPRQAVAQTEGSEQAFTGLIALQPAFEHPGKRQVGNRRGSLEAARIDALPGQQQPGQPHRGKRRKFAIGHQTHAFGAGIKAECGRRQIAADIEFGRDRIRLPAAGRDAAMQGERRVLAEFECAVRFAPGRAGADPVQSVAIAACIKAGAQVGKGQVLSWPDDVQTRQVERANV